MKFLNWRGLVGAMFVALLFVVVVLIRILTQIFLNPTNF